MACALQDCSRRNLPEEAKNHASRREGDQRDAVAQGVDGLYQDIKRDLQRKKNHVCELWGPAGDTGTVPRSQTAASPFTKGHFSLSMLGSHLCPLWGPRGAKAWGDGGCQGRGPRAAALAVTGTEPPPWAAGRAGSGRIFRDMA